MPNPLKSGLFRVKVRARNVVIALVWTEQPGRPPRPTVEIPGQPKRGRTTTIQRPDRQVATIPERLMHVDPELAGGYPGEGSPTVARAQGC